MVGSSIPQLPTEIRLAGGALFVLPEDGIWAPDRSIKRINTTLLDRPSARRYGSMRRDSVLHPDTAHLMRLYIAERLTDAALNTVQNHLSSFTLAERWLFAREPWASRPYSFRIEDLTVSLYDEFRIYVNGNTKARGLTASHLRAFYRWGVKKGLPGFSKSVFDQIKGLKLESARAGVATRFNDPTQSAFSFEEYVQISDALADEVGGDEYRVHRAVVDICRTLGIRTRAIVEAKRKHLWATEYSNGKLEYFLTVRRVKRRAGGTTQTVDWGIEERLALTLRSLYPSDHDDDEAPLIPIGAGGLDYEDRGTVLRHLMEAWADVADLRTTRVPPDPEDAALVPGGPFPESRLKINPYRFRRTVATMLALSGATPEEIAAALDDDTLEMAIIYSANTSGMVDLLDQTLDRFPEWIAILRMFRGEIAAVPDERLPVILGGVPYFLNFTSFDDIGEIGRCANPGPCRWNPPLHCYVCKYFRASSRGDHERQLVQIRSESRSQIGRESDRLLGVLRRIDSAIVQLIHFIKHGLSGRSPLARKIKQQRVSRSATGQPEGADGAA